MWYKRLHQLPKGIKCWASICKWVGLLNAAEGIPQHWLQVSALCSPPLQKCDYNYRNNWQHFRELKHAPAPRSTALSLPSIPPCLYLAVQPSATHHTLFPVQTVKRRKTASGLSSTCRALLDNTGSHVFQTLGPEHPSSINPCLSDSSQTFWGDRDWEDSLPGDGVRQRRWDWRRLMMIEPWNLSTPDSKMKVFYVQLGFLIPQTVNTQLRPPRFRYCRRYFCKLGPLLGWWEYQKSVSRKCRWTKDITDKYFRRLLISKSASFVISSWMVSLSWKASYTSYMNAATRTRDLNVTSKHWFLGKVALRWPRRAPMTYCRPACQGANHITTERAALWSEANCVKGKPNLLSVGNWFFLCVGTIIRDVLNFY